MRSGLTILIVMQTFNHFSEIAATTERNIIGDLPLTTAATANTVKSDDKVAALLEATSRDAVQFKGLAVICPDYIPTGVFEMSGDVLRLKQVTLVPPDRAGLTAGNPKDV